MCFIAIADYENLVNNCILSGHVVTTMNAIFDVLDDEVLKHDVFKVETVGKLAVQLECLYGHINRGSDLFCDIMIFESIHLMVNVLIGHIN